MIIMTMSVFYSTRKKTHKWRLVHYSKSCDNNDNDDVSFLEHQKKPPKSDELPCSKVLVASER